MKVWLIRLSMQARLDERLAARFSKAALLSSRAHPGHGRASRHEQMRALACEAGSIRRRRLPHDRPKRAAEGAEAVEPNVEANLGDGTLRLAQQLHGPLHPAALQVAMRRLAERGAELTAEMRRRYVGDTRERIDVEGLGEGAVHRVASPQHAAVAVLGGPGHRSEPTPRPAMR